MPTRLFLITLGALLTAPLFAQEITPAPLTVHDPRLQVELFAQHPQIVTPTGLVVDKNNSNRVFVIESNTHQRLANYTGPQFDQVKILTDTDNDGRADQIKIFHQGFTHAMDLAFGPDNWLYLSTRNQIYRLRDTNHDDTADEVQLIIDMQTASRYPHNGISSMAFDFDNNLYFGLGENRGQPYTLVTPQNQKLKGAHGNGRVFKCDPDGANLQVIADGFWNPFGLAIDTHANIFLADNDPGDRPPCRLIHIVPGGDYGYERRYVSGLHPLVAWDGELPGTLPMIIGTGEAPCAILPYESDALPEDYRSNLIVASWSDYRIERYTLSPNGASFKADMQVIVSGDRFFRPVDMHTAPNGTILLSDWADGLYSVHSKGRIWRIKPSAPTTQQPNRPADPRKALFSAHRPLREAAAKQLAASNQSNRQFLNQQVTSSSDPKASAAALMALISQNATANLQQIATTHNNPNLQQIAATALLERGANPAIFNTPTTPDIIRAQAIRAMNPKQHKAALLASLDHADPFIQRAAITALATDGQTLTNLNNFSAMTPRQRAAIVVALQVSNHRPAQQRLITFLNDTNPSVQLRAIKWIADEKLTQYKDPLENTLNNPNLTPRLFLATIAAIEQLELQPLPEFTVEELAKLSSRQFLPKIDYKNPKRLLDKVADAAATPTLRRLALRLLPPTTPGLTPKLITALLNHSDPALQLEAIRTLRDNPTDSNRKTLAEIAAAATRPTAHRITAITGLGASTEHVDLLINLATQKADLRAPALAALVGATLKPAQTVSLKSIAENHPTSAPAIARLTGAPATNRPSTDDLDAWVKLLTNNKSADAQAGRHVFFSKTTAACSNCHQHSGRGVAVGPDLTSLAANTSPKALIDSILNPSRNIAPQYRPWLIELYNGQTHLGIGLTKGGTAENYLDTTGKTFRVVTQQIKHRQELTTSFMPIGLHQSLTLTELRNLIAFLTHPQ